MTRVENLEGQIKQLTAQELTAFREWFIQFDADVWDRQFESDVHNSKLDKVQSLADKAFALLKTDPRHPSLHFKKVDRFWSARVGIQYRALGVDMTDGVLWFWIGSHADYDRPVG